jgi:large subunit ribosomal protein L15
MLTLNNLSPNKGSRRQKKRLGRGQGSGQGKTAGHGHKGARARSGYKEKFGFEGGQMPLHRRLPKRGFTNTLKKTAAIVTLSHLDRFEAGTVVNREVLLEAGIISKRDEQIKVLANGEITKNLIVDLDQVSRSAKEKITAAGGTVKVKE